MPAMETTGFSFVRTAALFALVYCMLVWFQTEQITGWGEIISQWRHEYYGEDGIPQGSLKFRTPEGRAFVSLSIPWGVLVYPMTIASAIWFSRSAIATRSTHWKIFYLLSALIVATILARFVWLGVFTVVTASF